MRSPTWSGVPPAPIQLTFVPALEDGNRVAVHPCEYLVHPEPLVDRGGGADIGFKHQLVGLQGWGPVGLVENVDVRGPSHIDGHRGGQGIGILTQTHAGTMVYRHCHWENVHGDGPVYSTTSGKAMFEGMFSRNCAMGCFRAGGDSIIRHCRVIQDHANQQAENTGQFSAANGIFSTSQTGEEDSSLIEDTVIIMEDTASTGQPLRVHNSAGELMLWNVDIVTHIDSDYPVWVTDPLKQYSSSYGNYRAKKPWHVDMGGPARGIGHRRGGDPPRASPRVGLV